MKDYGTFEIKSHVTDLGELCSCAGQLAIRGSPVAAAAGSPAALTGLSLSSGGAPSFSSGAPSLAASAGSWGGLSGGVSREARNSFRFTCGSASPDHLHKNVYWGESLHKSTVNWLIFDFTARMNKPSEIFLSAPAPAQISATFGFLFLSKIDFIRFRCTEKITPSLTRVPVPVLPYMDWCMF